MTTHKIRVFVDGASKGNPGTAGAGIIMESDYIKLTLSAYLGKRTNNQAEALAVLKASELLLVLKPTHVTFYLDSEFCVKALNGEYKIKNEELKLIFTKIQNNLKDIETTFTHIKREFNTEADALANKGAKRGKLVKREE